MPSSVNLAKMGDQFQSSTILGPVNWTLVYHEKDLGQISVSLAAQFSIAM